MERFERLARGAAGGTKLARRAAVNPELSPVEAMDLQRFLRGLRERFGEPDHLGDDDFSYSIRDRRTGIEFEAYSGASGPSYGGEMDCLNELPAGAGWLLREEVRRVLSDFDAWIEDASESEKL